MNGEYANVLVPSVGRRERAHRQLTQPVRLTHGGPGTSRGDELH